MRRDVLLWGGHFYSVSKNILVCIACNICTQPCTMMMVKCWSLLWGQMYPGEGSALQHKINPGQLTQFWSSLNFNKGQIEEIISHGLVLQSFHVKQISWQNHEWNRIKFRYTGFREYFKLYSIDGYIYRSIASFASIALYYTSLLSGYDRYRNPNDNAEII